MTEKECKWVAIEERLPQENERVITRLNCGVFVENSVEKRDHWFADGSNLRKLDWKYRNDEVTHWLDGIPMLNLDTEDAG